jgi:hypothetical protein
MGSVRFGIPRELVLALKAKYCTNEFFETGTLEGHTSAWAAEHFFRVTTVDVVPHPNAEGNLKPFANVRRHIDKSERLIVTEQFLYPTLFWLDAHTDEDCPVLKEIDAINRSDVEHVILVDDARLFDALTAWPRKSDVIKALEDCGRRTVYEVEDVLVAEPCP